MRHGRRHQSPAARRRRLTDGHRVREPRAVRMIRRHGCIRASSRPDILRRSASRSYAAAAFTPTTTRPADRSSSSARPRSGGSGRTGRSHRPARPLRRRRDLAPVVGIAGDVRHWGLTLATNPMLYWPQAQASANFLTFVLKTTSTRARSPARPAQQVAAVDPNCRSASCRTIDQVVAKSVRSERAQTILMGAFGCSARCSR